MLRIIAAEHNVTTFAQTNTHLPRTVASSDRAILQVC